VTEYPGPLTTLMFAGGPLANALASANSDGASRAGSGICPIEKWGITEITLSCAGKTSTSYQDPNHAPVPGGKAGRFYFAPLAESVKVAWKLKNKAIATTLTLELYRAGNAAPIWSRTLDARAAQAEQLDQLWDGSFPGGEWAGFPDHLVTVEHSPYKLKATAGPNHEDDLAVRWTYFDVLIDKIELTWGGKTLIPGGARADVDALYNAQTLLDEQAINDALALQRRPDLTLDPIVSYEVKMPCNQFTSWLYDMEDGNQQRRTTGWLNHEKQWGDGPRIPLVAKIYLAKAAGGGVHGAPSAQALGGTKFLWDWESRNEIAGLGASAHGVKVQTFLTNALDYLRNDGEGPPGSTNCHQNHGGKRGGAKKVFARLAAVSAGSTLGVTRKWASFEQAMLAGLTPGCVGVLFQPSRIALDTYRVSVYASPDVGGGGWAALDTADVASKVRTDYPSLPRAQSGVFEMLRQVRIRYVRKSLAVQTAVLASIAQEYRRAGIVIDWGATAVADQATLANNFQAWFAQSLLNPDPKGRGSLEPNRQWFEANDQLQAGTGADTAFGFIVKSWEQVVQPILVDSIREYVRQDRKINTTKKKYNKWLTGAGNTVANDHQYLLPFYNGLKKTKKAKVDTIFTRRFNVSTLPTKANYEANMESAGVHAARMIAEQLLVQINQHGMVIFHVETPVAYRETDGSIRVPDSQTGGLSPSTSSKWQGRGSIHLVFLPETPSADPDSPYGIPVTGVITHEAGHNLYLCHAPANDFDNGGPMKAAAGVREYAHDSDDLFCLMNYDQRSDHLCGYCNLKLRGWGTVQIGEDCTLPGPIDGGLVKLWHIAARNRRP
jgi:hypothetical protein